MNKKRKKKVSLSSLQMVLKLFISHNLIMDTILNGKNNRTGIKSYMTDVA
jgi:hypothetical protein